MVFTAPVEFRRWISFGDLLAVLQLGLCAGAALLPERTWPYLSRAFARCHVWLRGAKAERIANACERHLHLDPRQLELCVMASPYLENIEAIREILPGGWRRPVRLEGAGEIEKARRRGRGAVLWVGGFAHADLVSKKALADAGYALSHLSTPVHPFSGTWFGGHVLNPIRLRAENRYLAQRVIMQYRKARPALELLKRALSENGVVTITALGAGRSVCTSPLFGGTMNLATGAPRLALDAGAALLPVFTIPGPDGAYVVHCGPDLLDGLDRGSDAIQVATTRYVESLRAFVLDSPCKWRGWFSPTWTPGADAPEAGERPAPSTSDRHVSSIRED